LLAPLAGRIYDQAPQQNAFPLDGTTSSSIASSMITLRGRVSTGWGAAGPNLRHVEPLIAERMGIRAVAPGTLNVDIDVSYRVKPDAQISAQEYNGFQVVLLQRGELRGLPVVLMRPHTHELPGSEYEGHGTHHLELMASLRLRDRFRFNDGDPVDVTLEGDDEWWSALRRAI
jgi:CTP-dependent riboflavin kinase